MEVKYAEPKEVMASREIRASSFSSHSYSIHPSPMLNPSNTLSDERTRQRSGSGKIIKRERLNFILLKSYWCWVLFRVKFNRLNIYSLCEKIQDEIIVIFFTSVSHTGYKWCKTFDNSFDF